MSRILIVEDEQHLADGLRYNLEAEQHDVDLVDNGEEALERLTAEPDRYDLVILDLMLPGIDGFEVVAELRRARRFVPVLMLTARGRSEDMLRGFEMGADDYLPETVRAARFSSPACAACCAATSGSGRRRRRGRRRSAAQFRFRDKTIDFEQLEVRVGEKRMPLTLMEAALLRYLVEHEGPPVSRKAILERRVGRARRHRYPRHRQLHRPAAPLHRGRTRQPPAPADRPRRRLPIRGRPRLSQASRCFAACLAPIHASQPS